MEGLENIILSWDAIFTLTGFLMAWIMTRIVVLIEGTFKTLNRLEILIVGIRKDVEEQERRIHKLEIRRDFKNELA